MTTYTTERPLRIISLGWGVQSWTLAAMSALDALPKIDYAIHADTTHEAAATYAHAEKWTPWLEDHGIKVVTVAPSKPDVVRERTTKAVMIPAYTINGSDSSTNEFGQIRRQCTNDWKIQPIRRFIRSTIGSRRPEPESVESWQGISLDEWQRMRTSDVQYVKNVYPLVDRRITRAHCVSWLESHGLDVPPKSACTFCPYHSLGAWKRMKQAGGPDWDRAVEADDEIRDQRPPGQLFIHPGRLPLEEAVKIPEDFGAQQMEFEMPCDSGHCFV